MIQMMNSNGKCIKPQENGTESNDNGYKKVGIYVQSIIHYVYKYNYNLMV
jgi:hypothetical protein